MEMLTRIFGAHLHVADCNGYPYLMLGLPAPSLCELHSAQETETPDSQWSKPWRHTLACTLKGALILLFTLAPVGSLKRLQVARLPATMLSTLASAKFPDYNPQSKSWRHTLACTLKGALVLVTSAARLVVEETASVQAVGHHVIDAVEVGVHQVPVRQGGARQPAHQVAYLGH